MCSLILLASKGCCLNLTVCPTLPFPGLPVSLLKGRPSNADHPHRPGAAQHILAVTRRLAAGSWDLLLSGPHLGTTQCSAASCST